jgi:hypothetical protein
MCHNLYSRIEIIKSTMKQKWEGNYSSYLRVNNGNITNPDHNDYAGRMKSYNITKTKLEAQINKMK